MKITTKQKEELLSKREIIKKAGRILKKEFVGIDKVIDDVISSISSWFLFPDIQEKPTIINLWGLTGVGKSSLVKRLAELLHFNNKFYQFDLGENEKNVWSVKTQLEEIYENVNGFPSILLFDEFQHARTIDSLGNEIDNPTSRVIWQVLDSGRFQVISGDSDLESLYSLILKLKFLLQNGVNVANGYVTSKKKYFENMMGFSDGLFRSDNVQSPSDPEQLLFVPPSYYPDIYGLAKDKFTNLFDVRETLLRYNGRETIQFLLNIFESGSAPKNVDCSKSIVFVVGNLDEAYSMSDDFNPDMHADEFHEQTNRITIAGIKHALKKRFRNEQIARLGNNHILYPAFKKESFKKIISLELNRISERTTNLHGVHLAFDPSIHEMIYQEGVYPTQGTRPIFTTIHQIVQSKLGEVISRVYLKDINDAIIIFRSKKESVIVDILSNNQVLQTLRFKQHLNLGKLRINRKDDMQAITAVHEAGHAIISVILLKTIPEVIYSTTANFETGGFVYTRFNWKYVSRKEILSRVAMYMGGYAAEKVVFGEQHITTGAGEDIEKATGFIMQMLKSCGMGNFLGAYWEKGYESRNYIHDEENAIDKAAEAWMETSLKLAEETLIKQETLLLRLADHLSDHRKLEKKDILCFLKKYVNNFDLKMIIENGDQVYYRNHLKSKVSYIANGQAVENTLDTFDISLNNKP